MAFYIRTICLKGIVNKTLLIFLVFVNLAVKYQTDHQLWSRKYYECERALLP
jgi:hypothetical protein